MSGNPHGGGPLHGVFVVGGVAVAAAALLSTTLGALANFTAVLDRVGWTGVAAVAVTVFAVSWLTAQLRLAAAYRSRRQLGTAAVILVVGLVACVLTGTSLTTPKPPDAAGAAAGPGQSSASATPTSSGPSASSVPSDKGCPMPDPTDPTLPAVDVHIVLWCTGDVETPEGTDPANYQIKLRPRLINNTPGPIDISLSARAPLRLLVAGRQIDQRWSPPPRTRAAGMTTVLVRCDGQNYWAIPPNVPHDAVLVGDYYSGFVTSWDGTTLGPGESYFRPLRHRDDGRPVQEGNLVFQVPLDDEAADIYGLAVVDFSTAEPAILGVETVDRWGPKVDPTTF